MDATADRYTIFETSKGLCGLAWNDGGITCFRLPGLSAEATERALRRRLPAARPGDATPAVAEVIAAVRRYFEGNPTEFSSLAVDLTTQTPLARRIYEAARLLCWGQTTTYGALAKQLGGGPELARDVGQAMASNPVPLIIPCHRVLAAGGKIGGFSAPGGATAKLHMLELEGVQVAPPKPVQAALRLSSAIVLVSLAFR